MIALFSWIQAGIIGVEITTIVNLYPWFRMEQGKEENMFFEILILSNGTFA